MTEERKIVFYCSASYDIAPEFNQAAREAIRAACSLGFTIVSGGTVKGTMGEISDEVVKCGGRHVGVIPHFMDEYLYPSLDEVVWTDTMDERKEEMRKGTCAAVALPGGIGTLDELIGTMTVAKLKRYSGTVIALNWNGFYNPLVTLLDHYVTTGMMDKDSRELIKFPSTIEEFTDLLKNL